MTAPLLAPAMTTIHVAHSPDSDDAFMFYALAAGKIDTEGLSYVHQLQDIETLNQRALRGELEVTAVSIHAYAYLSDKYALLPHGASMGDRYGPRLVARTPMSRDQLRGKRIAVPGMLTSAYRGLHLVQDLGEWWFQETGLPLPLGGNVIRKDLGPDLIKKISRHLHDSIAYSLKHRTAALDHSMQYARGLERERADTFVGMYVNDWTLDYGDRGRKAVRQFLQRGVERGLIDHTVTVEFVD